MYIRRRLAERMRRRLICWTDFLARRRLKSISRYERLASDCFSKVCWSCMHNPGVASWSQFSLLTLAWFLACMAMAHNDVAGSAEQQWTSWAICAWIACPCCVPPLEILSYFPQSTNLVRSIQIVLCWILLYFAVFAEVLPVLQWNGHECLFVNLLKRSVNFDLFQFVAICVLGRQFGSSWKWRSTSLET